MTILEFFVAADGSRWIESSGLRPGMRVPSADRRQRVPDGVCHAVMKTPAGGPVAEHTACGLDLEGLTVFSSVSFDGGFLNHCPTCSTRVGMLRAVADELLATILARQEMSELLGPSAVDADLEADLAVRRRKLAKIEIIGPYMQAGHRTWDEIAAVLSDDDRERLQRLDAEE